MCVMASLLFAIRVSGIGGDIEYARGKLLIVSGKCRACIQGSSFTHQTSFLP